MVNDYSIAVDILFQWNLQGVDKTVGQYHHKDTEILRVHKGKKLCALRDFVVKSFGEPMKLSSLNLHFLTNNLGDIAYNSPNI